MNLTSNTNKNVEQQTPSLVEDFAELKSHFQNEVLYAKYRVELPNPDCITLYADGLTKIFINFAIWGSPERSFEYFSHAGSKGSILILVGSEQEFSTIDITALDQHIQCMILPQTRPGLYSIIISLHNLQKAFDKIQVEREQIEASSQEVKYMLSISRELNGERNIERLLSLILTRVREVTYADAGSIYTLEKSSEGIEDQVLRFHLTQNDSIEQNLSSFALKVSNESIVGKSVLSKKPINIPDLYMLTEDPKTNPWGAKHDKSWDLRTGYESHSMLTLPIYDISYNVTGVIQLINRKKDREQKLLTTNDFFDNVMPFDNLDVEYALIVSQQAGIALENASLNKEILNLFDGFVEASVTAIEQRDPTTSGHSNRVADLTLSTAKLISEISHGRYADVRFSDDQMREIKYASLLHDFGKVGVREKILVKAKKLYPWEMEVVDSRFDIIKMRIELTSMEKRIDFIKHPEKYPMGFSEKQIDLDRDMQLRQLDSYYDLVQSANEPTVLEQKSFDMLRDIANLRYQHVDGNFKPYLLSNELQALSVSRGSLTREEFAEIQNHVSLTYEFLRKIPWGRRLANVPAIAAKHHEKLDGTGYPNGSGGEEIPLQTRIMTIADIFDALTASDRPYKKAVPVDKALDILSLDVKSKKIDENLFNLFVESKVYLKIIEGIHQRV